MFLEYLESLAWGMLVFLVVLLGGIGIGNARRWKIKHHVMAMFGNIFLIPFWFVLAQKLYVTDKYNYHVFAKTDAELVEKLKDKGRGPLILRGSTSLEVFHTMNKWMFRGNAPKESWDKACAQWSEKFGLRKLERKSWSMGAMDLFTEINTDRFTWDEQYKSRVADNGAYLLILRDAATGDLCMFGCRW